MRKFGCFSRFVKYHCFHVREADATQELQGFLVFSYDGCIVLALLSLIEIILILFFENIYALRYVF